MGEETIAVCIPSYNRVSVLSAVLRMFEYQSDGDFDIIIYDDGSEEDYSILAEKHKLNIKIGHFLLKRWVDQANGSIYLGLAYYNAGRTKVLRDGIQDNKYCFKVAFGAQQVPRGTFRGLRPTLVQNAEDLQRTGRQSLYLSPSLLPIAMNE